MNTRSRGLGLAAVLLGLSLTACGGDSDPQDTTGPDPLTPERLAAALVTAPDLGADWSLSSTPDFPELAETGVVSDEAQEWLPRMEPCDAAGAEAQEAAEGLEWDAFRQLDLATGDPTRSPSPGKPPVHHLVFAQEFLVAGEPADIEATYDALVAGGDACLGTEETADGETVRTTGLTVPELGDGSHGWRARVTEPGGPGAGAGTATWDLRQVLVRDGGVLLMAQVAEITTPEVSGVLDDAQVESILATMVDRLP